jgi:hypothetical protein
MTASRIRETALRAVPRNLHAPLRRAIGRSKPWDPGARLTPPACPEGMRVGPPDFVGVGAQKAGTSWWFALVLKHPDVWRAPGVHKELHYFSRYWREPFTVADEAEYHRWFPRPEGKRTGEWTPIYMAQFWTPPLLARAAPGARILVLLRDPVERYRSGLTHHVSRGDTAEPRVATDAFLRGLYDVQVDWLLRCFGEDRVLVQQYERCRAETGEELARTYRFLDLDDGFVPEVFTNEVNVTRGEKVELSAERRAHLTELYTPSVARLAERVEGLDVSLWPNFGDLG